MSCERIRTHSKRERQKLHFGLLGPGLRSILRTSPLELVKERAQERKKREERKEDEEREREKKEKQEQRKTREKKMAPVRPSACALWHLFPFCLLWSTFCWLLQGSIHVYKYLHIYRYVYMYIYTYTYTYICIYI